MMMIMILKEMVVAGDIIDIEVEIEMKGITVVDIEIDAEVIAEVVVVMQESKCHN